MIHPEPPKIGAFTNAEITAANQRHDALYGYEMNTWTYSNPFRIAGHEPGVPEFDRLTTTVQEIWEWHGRLQKTNAC